MASWDYEKITYDPVVFPFANWLIKHLNEKGFAVTDLREIHQYMSPEALSSLGNTLGQDAANDPQFAAMYSAFSSHVFATRVDSAFALQRYPNFRFLPPGRPEMCIPFHTDGWYGHGEGERNAWVPLAGANGSASLQAIPSEKSKHLINEARANRLRLHEMNELFLPHAYPLEGDVGSVFLFDAQQLHGNIENTTQHTRVSIDFRVAIQNQRLGAKRVGGYFKVLQQNAG